MRLTKGIVPAMPARRHLFVADEQLLDNSGTSTNLTHRRHVRVRTSQSHGSTRRPLLPRPPNLSCRHRPAQQRERPARLHELRAVLGMCIAHEEPAGRKAFGEVGELRGTWAAHSGFCRREAFDDSLAVSVGLEAADAPEAGVAEGAVHWPMSIGTPNRQLANDGDASNVLSAAAR